MNDRDSLLSIVRELRRFAGAAYGKPVIVPVTPGQLNHIADRLDKIANAPAQEPVSPCDPNDPRPIWEQGLAAGSKQA